MLLFAGLIDATDVVDDPMELFDGLFIVAMFPCSRAAAPTLSVLFGSSEEMRLYWRGMMTIDDECE